MDLTKHEILQQKFYRPETKDWFKPVLECMQFYADQEAKAYANWLATQVIAGRTATKLFLDYKASFNKPCFCGEKGIIEAFGETFCQKHSKELADSMQAAMCKCEITKTEV